MVLITENYKIEGNYLTELLVKYKIRVNISLVIELYKIDTDYYDLFKIIINKRY